jgi:hypothetical protein
MSDHQAESPYPEHEKQAAVLDEAGAIGRFLDEGPYILAEYRDVDGFRDPLLVPVSKSIQQVLAEWLGIDLQRIEDEKRLMLDSMRAVASRADGQGAAHG